MVAPPTRTAILRRLEKIQGRGRARHDSHRRGTGERRSHGCRSRARIAVWQSPQCHRAFASNLEEDRGGLKTSEMLSDTVISRARNPESKSITVDGRCNTQGTDIK